MEVFSTIVFIDGNPVGYKVFRENGDQLSLNPAETPGRTINPPTLQVNRVNGVWKVEGTANPKIIEQVLRELSQNNDLPQYHLSAAP